MRAAFEAVAEFLARHGGLEEYDAVLRSMEHLGWPLTQDHAAQWRALFAVLRTELSDASRPTDFVFVFERLLQLYRHIPVPMCREVFSSPLIFHIIVERFAAAYADFDADVFRAEKEVLCHAENIYSLCELVHDHLFNGDEASALGSFLREFRNLFDEEDPKAAWEDLRVRYRLSEPVFRRDMKRMLLSLEEEIYGRTQIEELLDADSTTKAKRVIVPRRLLESKFAGTAVEWRALSDAVSVQGLSAEPPIEDRRESVGGGRVQPRMNEVVSETPPGMEHEDRVWSARLPIATPGGDSDASSGDDETAMDAVVRQEKPTQKKSTRRAKANASARSPDRPRQRQKLEEGRRQQSPARKRAEQSHVNTGGEDMEDDEFLDPAREFPVSPKRRRKGRRRFWSEEEVDALIKGVKRYGGKWKTIKDMYSEVLRNRSNVDIKDKYRNLVNAKRIAPIRQDDDE